MSVLLSWQWLCLTWVQLSRRWAEQGEMENPQHVIYYLSNLQYFANHSMIHGTLLVEKRWDTWYGIRLSTCDYASHGILMKRVVYHALKTYRMRSAADVALLLSPPLCLPLKCWANLSNSVQPLLTKMCPNNPAIFLRPLKRSWCHHHLRLTPCRPPPLFQPFIVRIKNSSLSIQNVVKRVNYPLWKNWGL